MRLEPNTLYLEPNTLYHGDAGALLGYLEGGSTQLIFSDPLYDDYSMYCLLTHAMAYALTPRGNTLLFVNSLHLAENISGPVRHNVPARVLSVVQQTGGALSGDAIAKSYHLIWTGSHRTAKGKMPDGWVSNHWASHYPTTHKWTKNPDYIGLVLEKFTEPGDLVVDPCMGHGLIPYMCKRMGRRYIGIERDRESFETAQRIVASAESPCLSPGAVEAGRAQLRLLEVAS